MQLNTASKRKYASVLGAVGGWPWFQRLLRVLRAIGDRHGSSVANVASRWVVDQPAVGALILGAPPLPPAFRSPTTMSATGQRRS